MTGGKERVDCVMGAPRDCCLLPEMGRGAAELGRGDPGAYNLLAMRGEGLPEQTISFTMALLLETVSIDQPVR